MSLFISLSVVFFFLSLSHCVSRSFFFCCCLFLISGILSFLCLSLSVFSATLHHLTLLFCFLLGGLFAFLGLGFGRFRVRRGPGPKGHLTSPNSFFLLLFVFCFFWFGRHQQRPLSCNFRGFWLPTPLFQILLFSVLFLPFQSSFLFIHRPPFNKCSCFSSSLNFSFFFCLSFFASLFQIGFLKHPIFANTNSIHFIFLFCSCLVWFVSGLCSSDSTFFGPSLGLQQNMFLPTPCFWKSQKLGVSIIFVAFVVVRLFTNWVLLSSSI